jgi:chaperonin cofactor prefoldin
MELDALIAELAKQDKAKVADALHSGAPSIWQEVFNKGHATATAASGEKIRTLEAKVTTAETDLNTTKQQLAEAEKGKPDIEKIRTDFTKEIGDLTQKHEKEKNQLKADLERERKSTVVEKLKTALGAKIDPDYADVQAQKAESRIRITATGYEIMQEGKEIPFAPASGQTAVGLLADEIIKAAPAKFQLAKTDTGGGSRNDSGGGGGGGTGLAGVRAAADAQRKKEAEQAAGRTTGAARLGLKTGT